MIRKLLGRLQNMAKEEVLRLIPADVYERIKQKDPHPEFRVYAIAHEGTAKGTIIERPDIVKQNWFKSAVKKLTNAIEYGIKLFHLHKAGSNDHDLRQPIGEVVGKTLREMNGKIYSMVAVYIYPEFRDMPLDIASIEADMVFEKQNDSAIIKDILRVTGIALGNSAVVKPAFAGATLLGTVQAFARRKKEGGSMTEEKIAELRALVKELEVKPSDVFEEDVLRNDPLIVEYVKKEKQGEYLHRKRTDEAFDRARAEWEKEKQMLESKIKELSVEKTKYQVNDVLQELAQERNLNEVQVKFINKNLKKFEVKEPEKVKEELDKFIDEQLNDFEETQKLLLGDKSDNQENADKGTPPADNSTGDEEDEYENPEKNEFINV